MSTTPTPAFWVSNCPNQDANGAYYDAGLIESYSGSSAVYTNSNNYYYSYKEGDVGSQQLIYGIYYGGTTSGGIYINGTLVGSAYTTSGPWIPNATHNSIVLADGVTTLSLTNESPSTAPISVWKTNGTMWSYDPESSSWVWNPTGNRIYIYKVDTYWYSGYVLNSTTDYIQRWTDTETSVNITGVGTTVRSELTDSDPAWSVDNGTTWYASGQKVELAPGSYTVSFRTISNYNAPTQFKDGSALNNITFTSTTSQNIVKTGVYEAIPVPVEREYLFSVAAFNTNDSSRTGAVNGFYWADGSTKNGKPVYTNGTMYLFREDNPGYTTDSWVVYGNTSTGPFFPGVFLIHAADASTKLPYEASWVFGEAIYPAGVQITGNLEVKEYDGYTVSGASTSAINGHYSYYSGEEATSSAIYKHDTENYYLVYDTVVYNAWVITNKYSNINSPADIVGPSSSAYVDSTYALPNSYNWSGCTVSAGRVTSEEEHTYLYTVSGLTGANAKYNGNYWDSGEVSSYYNKPIYTNGVGYMVYSDASWADGYYLYTTPNYYDDPADGGYWIHSENPIGTWDGDDGENAYGTMVVTAYNGGEQEPEPEDRPYLDVTAFGPFPDAVGKYYLYQGDLDSTSNTILKHESKEWYVLRGPANYGATGDWYIHSLPNWSTLASQGKLKTDAKTIPEAFADASTTYQYPNRAAEWIDTTPDDPTQGDTYYYTVTGNADYNGNYVLESGTHGTTTAIYHLASNTSKKLYHYSPDYWILGTNTNDYGDYYSSTGITGTYSQMMGTGNNPTVSEYAGGSQEPPEGGGTDNPPSGSGYLQYNCTTDGTKSGKYYLYSGSADDNTGMYKHESKDLYIYANTSGFYYQVYLQTTPTPSGGTYMYQYGAWNVDKTTPLKTVFATTTAVVGTYAGSIVWVA